LGRSNSEGNAMKVAPLLAVPLTAALALASTPVHAQQATTPMAQDPPVIPPPSRSAAPASGVVDLGVASMRIRPARQ
jgi:hypothetical protein